MAQRTDPIVLIEDLKPKNTIAGYKAACEESGLIAWADLLPIDDQPSRGFLLECGYNTRTGRDPGPRQIDRGTTLTSIVRNRMVEAMRAAGWREMGGQPGTHQSIWQHLSRMPNTRAREQAPLTEEERANARQRLDRPIANHQAEQPAQNQANQQVPVTLEQIAPSTEQVPVTPQEPSSPSKQVPVTLEQIAPTIEHVPVTSPGHDSLSEHVSVTPKQVKPDQVVRVNRKGKLYQRTVSAQLVMGTCQACQQPFAEMRYPGPPPRYCERCAKEVERIQRNARRMRSHYKHRAAAQSEFNENAKEMKTHE